MTTPWRTGATAALLDEYARAVRDLQAVLATVTPEEFTAIADPDTKDPDCRSIQTVMAHVVRSGYGYAIYISNKAAGESVQSPSRKKLPDAGRCIQALDEVLAFTEATFARFPGLKLEEYAPEKKILVRWGQLYDAEQLMEHAIVHILRHRRQIENFINHKLSSRS